MAEYKLMHKNIQVADVELTNSATRLHLQQVYRPEHLPVGVTGKKGVSDSEQLTRWWKGRSIPASRTGIEGILEQLQVETAEALAEKCYGLSLSDQYWIRPADLDVSWEQVNFFDNPFSEEVGNILLGVPMEGSEEHISLMTPDNTSDGWLKKKWTIIDGRRYLVKGGSGVYRQEPYNEVIASRLMELLGIPHVEYSLVKQGDEAFSICGDFVERSTELVSGFYVVQTHTRQNHHSSWQHYLACLEGLGISDGALRMRQMLTVDYLIANEDRHLNNFGVIRDADTLEWLDVAPVYDSGTSLWHNTHENMIGRMTSQPAKPFKKSHEEQILLVEDFSWLDVARLSGFEDVVEDVLLDAELISDRRRDIICSSVKKRISGLKQIVESN